ncbi:MAG: uncharacterized protein QG604_802 [Candidatus Dependentiae bacterium]|nr:uncharacterized protein [Candidatus Dependentiae bacterium]
MNKHLRLIATLVLLIGAPYHCPARDVATPLAFATALITASAGFSSYGSYQEMNARHKKYAAEKTKERKANWKKARALFRKKFGATVAGALITAAFILARRSAETPADNSSAIDLSNTGAHHQKADDQAKVDTVAAERKAQEEKERTEREEKERKRSAKAERNRLAAERKAQEENEKAEREEKERKRLAKVEKDRLATEALAEKEKNNRLAAEALAEHERLEREKNDRLAREKAFANANSVDDLEAVLEDRPDLVDARDAQGRTALLRALESGKDLAMVRYLLEHGASADAAFVKDRTNPNSFDAMMGRRNTEKMRAVSLALNANRNAPHEEGEAYRLEALRTLVDAGAEILKAPIRGHELGDGTGEVTPLYQAALNGDIAIMKYLIEECGVPLDENATRHLSTLATKAIKRRDAEGAAYIRSLAERSRTPVHMPSQYDLLGDYANTDQIAFINRAYGIDIVHDHNNFSIIHACRESSLSNVRALVEQHGLDVNTVSEGGNTPLLEAANMVGSEVGKGLPVLDYLISQGADVTAVDEEGNNVLHHLFENERGAKEQLQALDKLLKAGADPRQLNGAGESPLDVAMKKEGMFGGSARSETGNPDSSVVNFLRAVLDGHNPNVGDYLAGTPR